METRGNIEKGKVHHWQVTLKVETADKMTDRQIAARVREYFKPGHPVMLL